MSIIRILAAALLVAGSSAPRASEAQSPSDLARKVDQYLRPLVDAHDLNGVVLLARGDSILFQRAYGMADWNLNRPLTSQSQFRVASITKTFTAAAVSILAEEGKLSYKDSLAKFIPGFPGGEKIRIRQLLLHSSGVPNPTSQECSAATLDDLIAELEQKPLDFEPGTQARYSNGGYAVLARVIEAASGTTWESFLHERIFQPLGLSGTSIDRQNSAAPNRVLGYVPGPGAAGVEHTSCDGAWGAIGSGAAVSTAADLYRWGRDVRNEMPFKRRALEYPYGWGVRKYFDRNVIEQSGIVSGASSYLAVYLDDDIYVVVLSNLQSGRLVDIGKGLAALALGKEAPQISPSPASVEWRAAEGAKWLGRFTNAEVATIEISSAAEGLRLRWEHSPETVYISPTGPSTAYDRQDSIALTLSADGSAITMRWSGGDTHTFARIPLSRE